MARTKEHLAAIAAGTLTEWQDDVGALVTTNTPKWPALQRAITFERAHGVDTKTGITRPGFHAKVVEDGVEHVIFEPDEPRAQQRLVNAHKRAHAERVHRRVGR